jgi:hypothetical protein
MNEGDFRLITLVGFSYPVLLFMTLYVLNSSYSFHRFCNLTLPLFESISYVDLFLNSFFQGRKGDYYRYLAEFRSADERKEAGDQSLKAYEVFVNLLLCQSFSSSFFCHFKPFYLRS